MTDNLEGAISDLFSTVSKTIGGGVSANLTIIEFLIAALIEHDVLDETAIRDLIGKIEQDAQERSASGDSDVEFVAAMAARLRRSLLGTGGLGSRGSLGGGLLLLGHDRVPFKLGGNQNHWPAYIGGQT